MSIGWLTKVAQGTIQVTGYATRLDRIGHRDPGEITALAALLRILGQRG